VLGAVLADRDGDHAAEECWQEAARLLTEIGSPKPTGSARC